MSYVITPVQQLLDDMKKCDPLLLTVYHTLKVDRANIEWLDLNWNPTPEAEFDEDHQVDKTKSRWDYILGKLARLDSLIILSYSYANLPVEGLSGLSATLKKLMICTPRKLTTFPSLVHLAELQIEAFCFARTLPSGIGLFKRLKRLEISRSDTLETLPREIGDL
jgi:hypothetical protein